MSIVALTMVSALLVGQSTEARPAHPLAPSLPQLTAKEEAKYEAVIQRFILYDIGKLPGAAGKKALEDFNRLPPEAIFVLIDGFNQAANMEASCPAVVIGRKIMNLMNASEDLQLLAFAKENLGAGVTGKRHLGMLRDVQFSIQLRKGAVQRKVLASGNTAPPKSMASMSAAELAKHMTRQTGLQLKDLLKHDRAEVKIAAAKEVGARGLRFGPELIELLQDGDVAVSQASRAALARLNRGIDYGPAPDGSVGERETALRRWREWWDRQGRP